MSGLQENGVNAYFEKYNLKGINSSYEKSRTAALIFVAAVAATLFTFNHVPAKKVLGAMWNNNMLRRASIHRKIKHYKVV